MKHLSSLIAVLLLGVLSLALSSQVAAQVLPSPALMNFQGRLVTPDGNPVPDGTYSLRFSLWDALSAGTEKWNQTIASVTVKNGTFAVLLSGFPATTFDGNLWLETQIGTDTPLTPRQQLVSVAYAMKANSVPDGSITLNKIASDVLNFSNIMGIPTAFPPNGVAGGDLTGTYPNPIIGVAKIDNAKLTSDAASLLRVSGGVMSSVNGNIGIGTTTPLNYFDVFGLRATGSNAVDQQQTSASSGPNMNSHWQSFTAGVSGLMTRVDLWAYPSTGQAHSGTLYFYAGEGINGTLLAIQNITYQPILNNLQPFTLNYPIPVVAGQVYTVRFTMPPPFALAGFKSFSDTYAGGRAELGNSYDNAFRTYVTPASSGALFTVQPGGNVGIGVAQPGHRLSVSGIVESVSGGFRFPDGTTQTTAATTLSTAGGDLAGTYPNPTIAANAVASTELMSDTASLLRVSGGVMSSVNGNIGIGTTTPLNYFDVFGLRATGSNAVDQQQNDAVASAGGTDQWQSFTGGVSGLFTRIDLKVASPLNVASPGTLYFYAGEGTSGTLLATQSVTYQSVSNTFQTFVLDTPFLVTAGQIYTVRFTCPNITVGWVYRNSNNPYAGGTSNVNANTDYGFRTYVTPASSGSIFTVQPGGNVGIGVTQPGQRLSVSGIVESVSGGFRFPDGTIQTTAAGGSSTAGGDLTGTYPNPTVAPGAITAAKIAAGVIPTSLPPNGTAGGELTGTYPNPIIANNAVTGGKLASDIASLSRVSGGGMTALATGNIGIGTATPNSRLTVTGAETTANGMTAAVTLQNTAANGGRWYVRAGATGTSTPVGGLSIADDSAYRFSITNTGNVGIGTVNPATSLDISGSLTVRGGRTWLGNDGAFHWFGASPTAGDTDLMLGIKRNGVNNYNFVFNGNAGLGVFTPSYRLELPNNGNSSGQGRANAWVTYSSGRWKHNVTTIENPLEKLLQLRGVMFDWNVENGGTHDIGFVAEEVGSVIPELVSWEKDGKFAQGMKYDRVSALLVEAVKMQQKQVETLMRNNETMRAENTELKRQLSELTAIVRQIQAAQETASRDQALRK